MKIHVHHRHVVPIVNVDQSMDKAPALAYLVSLEHHHYVVLSAFTATNVQWTSPALIKSVKIPVLVPAVWVQNVQ